MAEWPVVLDGKNVGTAVELGDGFAEIHISDQAVIDKIRLSAIHGISITTKDKGLGTIERV
jgi:hypothetical protein